MAMVRWTGEPSECARRSLGVEWFCYMCVVDLTFGTTLEFVLLWALGIDVQVFQPPMLAITDDRHAAPAPRFSTPQAAGPAADPGVADHVAQGFQRAAGHHHGPGTAVVRVVESRRLAVGGARHAGGRRVAVRGARLGAGHQPRLAHGAAEDAGAVHAPGRVQSELRIRRTTTTATPGRHCSDASIASPRTPPPATPPQRPIGGHPRRRKHQVRSRLNSSWPRNTPGPASPSASVMSAGTDRMAGN